MDQTLKRAKPDTVVVSGPSKSLRVFKPFRTVGLVSTNVSCSVTNLGQSYVVSTAVGKTIQTYDAASLRLLFMTQPQAPNDIESIRSYFHHVLAVSGRKLLIYRRGQLETETEIPNKEAMERASKIEVFGGYVCVATSKSVSVFKWSPKAQSISFYTKLVTPSVLGNVVDIAHLPTYVNKLIVATQSCLVLFNVKSGKLLHTFGEIYQGISKVEAAPTALDTVAVVGSNGDIILLNVRTDRQLFTLTVGEPITTVSFRSDTGAGSAPLLGLGTANGDVFFYDLDLRRRVQSLRAFTREYEVTSVQFLQGQPIVMVSGADNTLTELVFDPPVTSMTSGKNKLSGGSQRCRVLRKRGGHSLPPSALLFADEEAHFLLSSSLDKNLWMFSLRKDSQSHSFGGVQKVDLPPITAMAYSSEKQERWDTLLTAHKSSNEARTWNVRRGALGAHKFATGDGSFCKAVVVSNCGNFGALGSAKGGITVFNLQSGLRRMNLLNVHQSAITALAILPNNSALISCSLDGTIKFIDFRNTRSTSSSEPKYLATINLEHGAITDMRFHASSGLLAVSTDSMALVVIDTSTKKTVRELWGHGNRITSFDFTPSGRWLISASLDSTIRTWDIPTGACIDGVKIRNPVTNLRISPNSEWIATSHVHGVGIQLWALLSSADGATFRNIGDEDLVDIDMPTASGENGVSLLESALGTFADEKEDTNIGNESISIDAGLSNVDQLSPGLTTLSGEPANKFTTLVHLDAIRERNKPRQGVQKPEKVPFFLGLPTDESTQEKNTNNNASAITTGELTGASGTSVSRFTQMLQVGDLEGIVLHMSSLGPAATDLEIRSLDTSYPFSELIAFLDAMTTQIVKGVRFELVQAWMSIFLRVHGDIFYEGGSEPLDQAFRNWKDAQKQSVENMQEQTRFCAGVLSYIRQL